VDLFGHSWGGIVVLRYASLHPDRVRSIVLMGSGPPTDTQTRQCQDAIARRIAELTAQGVIVTDPEPASPEAERGVLPAYFSDPTFWFSDDDRGGAPHIDARTAEVGELTWTAIAGFDLTPDLTDLDHRVLNLWGVDDPARSIASPAISTALPRAHTTTVVLEAYGHFWHECPDEFFAAVRRFLDDGDAPAATD
jgi:proline iminopeptidase